MRTLLLCLLILLATPVASQEDTQDVSQSLKFLKVCSGEHQQYCRPIASMVLSAYLLMLVFSRFAWVILPNNAYLRGHALQIKARLDVEPREINEEQERKKTVIRNLLSEVLGDETYNKRGLAPRNVLWYEFRWFFAFTGRQLSAWRIIHEAERLAIDLYPVEVVKDQCLVVLEKLKKIGVNTTELEKAIRDTIDKCKAKDAIGNNDSDIKEFLKEAKVLIYAEEDQRFQALADAQNQAFWLVLVTVLLLFGLAVFVAGTPLLFLAGATGGILARLRKIVRRTSIYFDYGISWTILFLTPLVGALTGWAGTAICQILYTWEVLGVHFKNINVLDADLAAVIVAVVFGMSATLFDRFVEKIEANIEAPVERDERKALP